MSKWMLDKLDPDVKHPIEQLVGVVSMLVLLRYGYMFIESSKTLFEIVFWLIVGFGVLYVIEHFARSIARRLPIVRKRLLIPIYLLIIVLFFLSFRIPRPIVEPFRQWLGI